MRVKVTKWGNSLGVRLPKAAAEAVGVGDGAELDLTIEGSGFRLRRTLKTSAQRLNELLDQIDPNNVPPMVEWGPDVGSEIIDDDYSRRLIVPGPDGMPVYTDKASLNRKRETRDVRSRRR